MEKDYIYTDRLTVGYQKKPLIEEISLHIRQGQIVTLIGPNGAGKSTILKTITKQLAAVRGTVYIEQQPLEHYNEKALAKKLAIVMTNQIHPELMTCEDVVSTGRYPYTGQLGILRPEDKEKVRDAMQRVHALELADRDFNAVSDGQRQRILLARAICQEPDVIVLDEPTSFLDIRHKLELLAILKEMVQEKHIAVLMSLHELDLAQRVSDYVVCVHGSRIEHAGTPEEIFTSEYIRQLYQVEKGSYNALFGCVEMEAVKAQPQVFVIGGNGSGIAHYRRLTRQGIPFAAGILMENDVDCQVAQALASEMITVPAFALPGEEDYEQALAVLKMCSKVLCPLQLTGQWNEENRRLKQYADEQGMLTKW